jgi:hypothetical protein
MVGPDAHRVKLLFQLRQRAGLGHREHFQAVLKALAIPACTEAGRRLSVAMFGLVMEWSIKQKTRLEASRDNILKELKVRVILCAESHDSTCHTLYAWRFLTMQG